MPIKEAICIEPTNSVPVMIPRYVSVSVHECGLAAIKILNGSDILAASLRILNLFWHVWTAKLFVSDPVPDLNI
jgi:hypothetical protein